MNELYADWLVDHGKAPRNQGPLDGATHRATTTNPMCGDRVTVHLRVDGDRVLEARFEARGCAICTASASLLTGWVHGIVIPEALALADRVAAAVSADAPAAEPPVDVWMVVRRFPARRRCATLAWEALRAALHPST